MATTTYTIELTDGLTVQTTNAETAERESRGGATVTASTTGVDA